jgi:CRISPR-associated protein (TIGR02710 family)
MRELGPEVEKWVKRGSDYSVLVDLTGGTKCMSAALALAARRWPCQFAYVGGADLGGAERTKGGVGVVVSGKEQIVYSQNPWDSLGYQAVEDAVALLDQGDYEGAKSTLDQALKNVARGDIKSELAAFKLFCEAYQAWDIFDHDLALKKLGEVARNANNIRHLFGIEAADLLRTVQSHQSFLRALKDSAQGRFFLLDLCANARRCADRGRYDDAVSRLYRMIEATAQLRLREEPHYIADTGKIPLDMVPEALREQWAIKASEDHLMLGLQDDFQLLKALGDVLGQRFEELGLAGERGPLQQRNGSILAHGFTTVRKGTFDSLWRSALRLAEINEDELPRFPRLGQRR